MLRASLVVVAATMLPLFALLACNDVETQLAPDAGNKVCDPGPFVYDSEAQKVVGLGTQPTTPACGVDDNHNSLLDRLPRGSWYLPGWKVYVNGTNDPSGQGECVATDICTCSDEPDGKGDAGPTGVHWNCYFSGQ
jgi:hypothetical protein